MAGIEDRAIRQLASYYGLFDGELAHLLGIKMPTLQRREKGARLPPGDSDRLSRVAVMLREATEVPASRAKAASWLRHENRTLGGFRPLDMSATEAGYEQAMRKHHRSSPWPAPPVSATPACSC